MDALGICVKRLGMAFVFVMAFLLLKTDVRAAELELLEEFEFSEIEEMLEDVLDEPVSFQEMVGDLVQGKGTFSPEDILDTLISYVKTEFSRNRRELMNILVIAIIAAVFTGFSNIFEKPQIADISFYMVYILLFAVILKSFQSIAQTAGGTVENIIIFMKALIPAYFLSVAFASGATTAALFYQFTLFMIYAVNFVLLYVVIPLVNVYVIFTLINYLSKEDVLSKLNGLLEGIIKWILKSMFAVVIGFQVIQSLITPVIDSVRSSILQKSAGMIPGLGGAANAAADIVIGSAILIKNGIGAAALIILLLICAAPVLKIGIFVFAYKLITALIQPVSDARMTGCVNCAAKGAGLLLKTASAAAVLFMLSIAILSATTNRGF